ncbi:Uncharacterised protein [Vibrio cholerae]|nr:Uncharacterised protein [Vibrio cholerae]
MFYIDKAFGLLNKNQSTKNGTGLVGFHRIIRMSQTAHLMFT